MQRQGDGSAIWGAHSCRPTLVDVGRFCGVADRACIYRNGAQWTATAAPGPINGLQRTAADHNGLGLGVMPYG